MYVRSLDLRNFACFEEARAEFQYPGRTMPETSEPAARPGLENLNLILGDNGSGKTSVLRAVALAVLGQALSGFGFRPYYLIRGSSDTASVDSELRLTMRDLVQPDAPVSPEWNWNRTTDLTGHATLERVGDENRLAKGWFTFPFTRDEKQVLVALERTLYIRDSPAFFVCGYGAGRRGEDVQSYDEAARSKGRAPRYQRIASLFEDGYSLTAFSAWLIRSSSAWDNGSTHFAFFVSVINKLLAGTGVTFEGSFIDSEALFRLEDGLEVPFPALSDGFRAFLAWVGDMLKHLSDVTPNQVSPGDIAGVVMVDEVDLHLHPSWQRVLLERLATVFPRLQFIVTSHSPILAGSLPPENILVVERKPGGPSTITLANDDLYGKSVNQILHSPYFNLTTTLPPSLAQKENEHRQKREDLAREVLQNPTESSVGAYLKAIDDSDSDLEG